MSSNCTSPIRLSMFAFKYYMCVDDVYMSKCISFFFRSECPFSSRAQKMVKLMIGAVHIMPIHVSKWPFLC